MKVKELIAHLQSFDPEAECEWKDMNFTGTVGAVEAYSISYLIDYGNKRVEPLVVAFDPPWQAPLED